MVDMLYDRSEANSALEALNWKEVEPQATVGEAKSLPVLSLAPDEYLFREGNSKKHVYRVESGALCVTSRGEHGMPEFIELAHPGDLVGLGFLDHHADSAAALVDTKVSVWSLQALSVLTQSSTKAEEKQADATEREFLSQRRRLVASTSDSPLKRVAAFLLVVSRLNAREGRDRDVISEGLSSGDVAAFLGMDVETLGRQLVELQKREFINLTGNGGIRLEKTAELERFAGVTG